MQVKRVIAQSTSIVSKMLYPTSLILLPFVFFVFSVLNSSEAVRGKRILIREAENIIGKLDLEHDDLENSFADYKYELVANNDLIHAMKAYREAYALTEGTNCAGEEPANEDADDRVIQNYASGCMQSLSKDEMLAFFKKVTLLRDKSLEINKAYNEAYRTNDRYIWEARRQAIDKLNGLLTPQLEAKLKHEAIEVLKILKSRLDECFKSKIAEKLKHLLEGTVAINTCLDSIPN